MTAAHVKRESPPIDDLIVERVGLGFHGHWSAAEVDLDLDHVHTARGELRGELHVTWSPPEPGRDPHIAWGTFAVSSLTQRATVAKALDAATGQALDWLGMLETFCVRVMLQYRHRREVEVIGGAARVWPDEPYILRPLLKARNVTTIFAAGGTGKTHLAAGCAVSATTGKRVIPGIEPVLSAPGVVLDWEDHARAWDGQIRAIARGMGIDPPEIFYRQMFGSFADQIPELADLIADHGLAWLILDSVEAASGGHDGEGWNDRAARVFDGLRELDIAALLLDHVAATDIDRESPTAKPIGGVAKSNRSRAAFELSAEREPADGRIEYVLRDAKHNLRRSVAPVKFCAVFADFDDDGTAHSIRYEVADIQAAELVSKLPLADRIEHTLRDSGKDLTPTEIADRLKVKPDVVRMTLHRKKDERFVRGETGLWGLMPDPI